MSLVELGLSTLGIMASLGIALLAVFFIFWYLSRKLSEKVSEWLDREARLEGSIAKVNDARLSDMKEIVKRIDLMEKKLDALLQPEGDMKEVEKEKAGVHARKRP